MITRMVIVALVLLFLGLQYRLWFSEGGLLELQQLKHSIFEQQNANQTLQEQNSTLAAEVEDLKMGSAAVEERARSELGMIKKDEKFYQTPTLP